MLNLLVDRKIIEFVQVLQKPQIVMQLCRLFAVLKDFTKVQEMVVDFMKIYVLAF